MKAMFVILVFWFFSPPAFADEDLLKPIGASKIGDSIIMEAIGGYRKISQDSLFPVIEELERAFEKSRPFYGQYYFWIGYCGETKFISFKNEVKNRRISNLLVGCRDLKSKGIQVSRIKGNKIIEKWEREYLELLDTIQMNSTYIHRRNENE